MKRKEALLLGGEVAALLALQLGLSQNWEGLLNDFRQDRRDFGCAPLLPVAKAKRGGRAAVPCYRPIDVTAFIDRVRTVYGTATPFPFVPRFYEYEIDDSAPNSWWFARIATPTVP